MSSARPKTVVQLRKGLPYKLKVGSRSSPCSTSANATATLTCPPAPDHVFSLKDEAHFADEHHTAAFTLGRGLRDCGIDFDTLQETVKGSPSSNTKVLTDIKIRSPSPCPSNSSEDEVIFKGRGATQRLSYDVRSQSEPKADVKEFDSIKRRNDLISRFANQSIQFN